MPVWPATLALAPHVVSPERNVFTGGSHGQLAGAGRPPHLAGLGGLGSGYPDRSSALAHRGNSRPSDRTQRRADWRLGVGPRRNRACEAAPLARDRAAGLRALADRFSLFLRLCWNRTAEILALRVGRIGRASRGIGTLAGPPAQGG